MRRTRARPAHALRTAALAGALLAGCCPVPAGPPAAAGAPALPARGPAPGPVERLTVRTSAGPAAQGGRLARTTGGDVVRLVPDDGVALPPDAALEVTGRLEADGTLRVRSASPLRTDVAAP